MRLLGRMHSRCFPGLTTAPQLLPAFWSNSWTGYSLCRMPRIFKACHQDHIQPLLQWLHWLWMPERVSAPGYLASDLQRVSHLNARRRLCSSTTSALGAPCTMRSTIGDCTLPATAASVWNSLPESVPSSPSLQVFRSRLKTEIFAWSYRHD